MLKPKMFNEDTYNQFRGWVNDQFPSANKPSKYNVMWFCCGILTELHEKHGVPLDISWTDVQYFWGSYLKREFTRFFGSECE